MQPLDLNFLCPYTRILYQHAQGLGFTPKHRISPMCDGVCMPAIPQEVKAEDPEFKLLNSHTVRPVWDTRYPVIMMTMMAIVMMFIQ